MTEININGEIYVKKSDVQEFPAHDNAKREYVIIRTYSAGVHAGYLSAHNGKEVTLVNARRLWYWSGAFTLSEIAVKGVSKPEDCKFSCSVPMIILTEAIEIIPCTEQARRIIEEVKVYECK